MHACTGAIGATGAFTRYCVVAINMRPLADLCALCLLCALCAFKRLTMQSYARYFGRRWFSEWPALTCSNLLRIVPNCSVLFATGHKKSTAEEISVGWEF